MRDEVNEPLGLAPSRPARSTDERPRGMSLAVAAASLALVVSVAGFARRDAQRPDGPVAADKAKAETATAKLETTTAPPGAPPAPSTDLAELPPLPPIASADRVEQASGVKVTRKGGAGAPAALIIDVQQALAQAKLRAALDAEH